MATLVAFGLVGSASAVEINENLSINGFIDGSISKTDNGTAIAGGDTADWGLDEIEVNFLFNVGSVSGTVNLDSQAIGSGNDDIELEQAHFTYTLENGVSLTFGRYGSALGLEREDPAGLYTFSRAYAGAFNFGDVDNNAVEGLTLSYAADAWSLGVSIENPAGSIRSGGSKDDLNYEVALSYTGIENLTVGIGHFKDNQAVAANEVDATNINATYQVGKALLGAEWSQLDQTPVTWTLTCSSLTTTFPTSSALPFVTAATKNPPASTLTRSRLLLTTQSPSPWARSSSTAISVMTPQTRIPMLSLLSSPTLSKCRA